MTAEFRCLACEHEFTKQVDANHPASTDCPKCGHLYVKWLNYAAFDLSKGRRSKRSALTLTAPAPLTR